MLYYSSFDIFKNQIKMYDPVLDQKLNKNWKQARFGHKLHSANSDLRNQIPNLNQNGIPVFSITDQYSLHYTQHHSIAP